MANSQVLEEVSLGGLERGSWSRQFRRQVAGAFCWAGSGCPAHTGSLLDRFWCSNNTNSRKCKHCQSLHSTSSIANLPWLRLLLTRHYCIILQFQLNYLSRAGLSSAHWHSPQFLRYAKNNHPALLLDPAFSRHHCLGIISQERD